eukprot:SAG31_NODE_46_length_30980_cov_226.095107_6_plen_119_part_00
MAIRRCMAPVYVPNSRNRHNQNFRSSGFYRNDCSLRMAQTQCTRVATDIGFQGRAEIAQILIDAGVPVNDEHKDGHNPVVRACWGREQRHADTVEVMLKAGATLVLIGINWMHRLRPA